MRLAMGIFYTCQDKIAQPEGIVFAERIIRYGEQDTVAELTTVELGGIAGGMWGAFADLASNLAHLLLYLNYEMTSSPRP